MKPRRRGRKWQEPAFDAHDADTTCLSCHAEFLEPEDLRVHVAQMHPYSDGHSCNFCACSFLNIFDYLLHIRDVHLTRMQCCLYCCRGFIDTEELKLHEKKHLTPINGMHSCSHCQVLFNNLKALENHEGKSHSNSKDGVMLHNHYALLSTMLNMNAQTFIKSLGTDNIYICVKCKFTTVVVALYLGHVREKKCVTYTCDNCLSVFSKRNYLTKHFSCYPECSHNYDPAKFKKKCLTCNQAFDHKLFNIHFKKCKIIKCKQCDITFESVAKLTEHQVKEHPVALVLKKCRYCHQEIVGNKALAKHMQRLHKNDYHLYKYKCKVCNAIYKHPKLLLGHLFSKHRGLKPFSCDICNEKWRVRKTFTVHIKHKHNSRGFVEFDESMNVHFSEKKSEKPFQPPENESLYNDIEAKELPPIESDCETEAHTDVEATSSKGTKKKKIKTPKNKPKSKPQDINITNDLTSDTDTNLYQEKSKKNILKRKRDSSIDIVDSSDDENLLMVRKRVQSKRKENKLKLLKNKNLLNRTPKRLTCNICKKYCYTIENYHRHVAVHFKNESKQCIKCSELFSTTDELEVHLRTSHATGHITDTLKNLLEKRKKNLKGMSRSSRFRRTVKKVLIQPSKSTARLRLFDKNDMSVKNFIENFTPEEGKNPIAVDTMIKLKPVDKTCRRKTVIKMTKFKENRSSQTPYKLAMPEKFKVNVNDAHVLASMKLVQVPYVQRSNLNFGAPIHQEDNNHNQHNNADNDDAFADADYSYGNSAQTTIIPDVAQEVMLENTEDEPRPIQQPAIPHRMIIPKITQNSQKIQIAHLQPQAPFYKIVPFDELMSKQEKIEEVPIVTDQNEFTLPSGRKLVNINPLAHLLGDRADEILKSCEQKRKYYHYKPKFDRKKALAEALIKLEKPSVTPRIRTPRPQANRQKNK